MQRALAAELSKLKRTKLPFWSVLAVLFAPSFSNVFATSASGWTERVSWSEFFEMGPMTMATWYGILLFGLLTAFLFGREYAEGVAPNLLTVPTRREYFVFAKFAVLAAWILTLAVVSSVAQATWAFAFGMKGFAWAHLWPVVGETLTVSLLIYLTLPVVALVALVGRGVFAPMIFSAFGFSAGMYGGIAGWGDWLPWAMPTVVGGSFLGPLGVANAGPLTAGSWAIAVGVFVLGLLATIAYVNHADSRG